MRSLRIRILLGTLLWTISFLLLFRLMVVHSSPTHHRVTLAVALLFMTVGTTVALNALTPLRRLRSQLLDLRDGRQKSIAGPYPTELQPLVDDFNGLLNQRERAVELARVRAADLAHGLKTPLAILRQEAEQAKRDQYELADTLLQQVERMRRQIEHHLAQSRIDRATGPGMRCSVSPTMEALGSTLKRLHSERNVTLEFNLPESHAVRVRCEDFEEMFGNLLDNAFTWCVNRVVVASSTEKEFLKIVIEDNGPGITKAMRDAVLLRGVRADETTPGSGLGLAITNEIVLVYGGSIVLDESPIGGLAVIVQLPRAR